VTAAVLVLGFAAPSAYAQAKITRLVVAFPPGGPVDFVARTIGEQLGKELGSQVIIENRAGANGAIAAEYVARATPDGSTLWLTSVGAVAINPPLYEKLPYDPVRDLAPVSLVANNVELLVVGANNPANSGAEFIANARLRKDGATMASSGTGSVPHLAMELLADSTKAPLVHVPYKGAAPAITDVIAGHVDGFFGDIPGPGRVHQGRQAQAHRHRIQPPPPAAARGENLPGNGHGRRRLRQLVCAVRRQGDTPRRHRAAEPGRQARAGQRRRAQQAAGVGRRARRLQPGGAGPAAEK
jgi:hypothetical protein